jgi:hypothetical protein
LTADPYQVVPEPTTALLVGLGFVAIAAGKKFGRGFSHC